MIAWHWREVLPALGLGVCRQLRGKLAKQISELVMALLIQVKFLVC